MILPIYVYGQPVLRKVAEDITPDYPNLKELIENMFETMVHADGVGLAAPQIGLPIRVVTITLDPLSEEYPEFKDFNKAYINPHILESGFNHVYSQRFQCLCYLNLLYCIQLASRNLFTISKSGIKNK